MGGGPATRRISYYEFAEPELTPKTRSDINHKFAAKGMDKVPRNRSKTTFPDHLTFVEKTDIVPGEKSNIEPSGTSLRGTEGHKTHKVEGPETFDATK